MIIEPNKRLSVEGGSKIRGKETGFVGMERSFRYEGGVGGGGWAFREVLPVRGGKPELP